MNERVVMMDWNGTGRALHHIYSSPVEEEIQAGHIPFGVDEGKHHVDPGFAARNVLPSASLTRLEGCSQQCKIPIIVVQGPLVPVETSKKKTRTIGIQMMYES